MLRYATPAMRRYIVVPGYCFGHMEHCGTLFCSIFQIASRFKLQINHHAVCAPAHGCEGHGWPALPLAFLTSFLAFLAVFVLPLPPPWLLRRSLTLRNVFLA